MNKQQIAELSALVRGSVFQKRHSKELPELEETLGASSKKWKGILGRVQSTVVSM
jgi:hypothetical protein